MKLSLALRSSAATIALLASSAGGYAAISVDDFVPKNLEVTLSGAYLAGRSADAEHDFGGAIPYYASAFAADPTNSTLGERLVTLALADGQMSAAFGYSQQLIMADPSDPIGLIALGAQAFDQGQLDRVAGIVAPVTDSALGKLTAGLMTAWAGYGLGKVDQAVQTIDALSGPTWYGVFKDYNTAVMLDAAGRVNEAALSIAKAYQTDATALDTVLAYAQISARNGERDKALKALNMFLPSTPVQAPVQALIQSISLGQKPGPVIASARIGAGNALYGLGVAIGTDQGAELPALYLRLAALLDPTSDLTVLSLGDVFQATDNCTAALGIYDVIKVGTPLRRNADTQTSNCLMTLNRPDDAVVYAKRVADANPKDIDAVIQLGNVYRAGDHFADAAQAYSRGIDANPAAVDWRVLYYRGVAYQMANMWPQAEADFQHALMLNPGQPQVLNYLGYSWVDQGLHLDQALNMIKMASDQRPNDGYIVDSLGWAYYRLGRYQDAVVQLERAVKLSPEESTLNDHLGDAYWMVGRKREATFQWSYARDFDPDPMDLPKILAKLQHGLTAAAPLVPPANPAPAGALAASTSVTVQPGDTLSSIAARVYGDPSQTQRIYDANRSIIKDPAAALSPGMVLVVPGATAH